MTSLRYLDVEMLAGVDLGRLRGSVYPRAHSCKLEIAASTVVRRATGPRRKGTGENEMRAISLAEANKIIDGTFASGKKRKAHALAAIVLDAGGRVKAFQKQDGASLMRFEIAYGKAFGALALNRSSRQVLQKAKEKPAFMQSLAELADGPLFLEAGGQLIRDASGEIVGALGVTGDVNEVDDLCAIDGIHAGGFRADADFDVEAAKRLNIKVDPPLRDPRKG
jgi:uncharacterized protein GlcG (DUF336 family)